MNRPNNRTGKKQKITIICPCKKLMSSWKTTDTFQNRTICLKTSTKAQWYCNKRHKSNFVFVRCENRNDNIFRNEKHNSHDWFWTSIGLKTEYKVSMRFQLYNNSKRLSVVKTIMKIKPTYKNMFIFFFWIFENVNWHRCSSLVGISPERPFGYANNRIRSTRLSVFGSYAPKGISYRRPAWKTIKNVSGRMSKPRRGPPRPENKSRSRHRLHATQQTRPKYGEKQTVTQVSRPLCERNNRISWH